MADIADTGRGGDILIQAGVGFWRRGGNVYICGGGNVGGSETGGENVVLAYNGGAAFGKVGVGILPTAYFHIMASDGGENNAPLKFTSGTLLDSPEKGSF
jgi:hypothetical protein